MANRRADTQNDTLFEVEPAQRLPDADTSVGRSWRTQAKHDLMNKIEGQEIGAANSINAINRLIWIDLTAGDGAGSEDVDWSRSCSPGIHVAHAMNSAKLIEILLYEINSATYAQLLRNLNSNLQTMGFVAHGDSIWRLGHVTVRAYNADGRTAPVNFVGAQDAVLVINDPNAITDWAMRDSFAQEITDRTSWFRSLSTLGCNPSGIKRLPFTERVSWFGMIDEQQAALPRHRDLMLAVIEKDSSQWAYLVSTAERWRATSERDVRGAFRTNGGKTVAITWCRRDPAQFEETKRALIYTKDEMREVG